MGAGKTWPYLRSRKWEMRTMSFVGMFAPYRIIKVLNYSYLNRVHNTILNFEAGAEVIFLLLPHLVTWPIGLGSQNLLTRCVLTLLVTGSWHLATPISGRGAIYDPLWYLEI